MSEELLVEEESAEETVIPEKVGEEETVAAAEIIEEETTSPEENAEGEPVSAEEHAAAEEVKKPDFQEWLKKALFWEIVVGMLVVLVILILVINALSNPDNATKRRKRSHKETEVYSETLPANDSATEQTYLPIDRNPIGEGDFYTDENGYLVCMATASVVGIDVSEWQGSQINWKQVKESGVEFVMIRVGWRGSGQGVLSVDTYAQSNYAGASAAGLKVGAYIFSQAITPEEAVEEANYLLEAVKDWNVEMPLVFDWEYIDATSRTANVDARTLTDCAIAFCETIKNAGYTPMVYFNTNQSMDMLYLVELDDYLFWLAQYNGGGLLYYDYKVDMWQYTDSGTVPGISVPVDINLYFPYEE